MRFLEALLLILAAIYVAQLIIAALILATLMLFLWCLWKRPRESLILGVGLLLLAFISKPIGLALLAAIVLGLIGWALLIRFRSRRPMLLLTHRKDG